MEELVDFLSLSTGMELEGYHLSYLERNIKTRMTLLGCSTPHAYLEYIRLHPEENKEIIDKFTVNYSFFFRNQEVFKEIKDLLTRKFSNKADTIKVWSCPCASGEEPYSIAMLLDQIRQSTPEFPNYMIIASDIDQNAINIASRATYKEYSLHETPQIYIDTYFVKKNQENTIEYTLKEKIKKNVKFLPEDLTKGHAESCIYDIILCRNFIIYLNELSRKKVLKMLEAHLVEGGILVLGKTEIIWDSKSCFKLIDANNKIYVKRESKNNKKNIIQKEGRVMPVNLDGTKTKHITLTIPELSMNGMSNKEDQIIEKKSETRQEKSPTTRKLKKPKTLATNKEDVISTPVKPIHHVKAGNDEDIPTNGSNRTEDVPIKETYIPLPPLKSSKALENKVIMLEKRVSNIENLNNQYLALIIKLQKRIESIENKERDLEVKEVQVEKKVESTNQRIRFLKHLEKQVESRIMELESCEKKISRGDQSKDARGSLKKKTKQKRQVSLQITEPNLYGELRVPLGYHAIIDLKSQPTKSDKIAIYDLRVGMVLFLKDSKHEVFGACYADILQEKTNQNSLKSLKVSFDTLLYKMLKKGARKDDLSILIFGGGQEKVTHPEIYQESLRELEKELESLKISIEREDLGGISERSIIFDVKKNLILEKKQWEEVFRPYKK